MMDDTAPGISPVAPLPGWAEPLVEASRKAGEDTAAALRLAEEFGRMLPQPGGGGTAARWAVLAAASRESLTPGGCSKHTAMRWRSWRRPVSRSRPGSGGVRGGGGAAPAGGT